MSQIDAGKEGYRSCGFPNIEKPEAHQGENPTFKAVDDPIRPTPAAGAAPAVALDAYGQDFCIPSCEELRRQGAWNQAQPARASISAGGGANTGGRNDPAGNSTARSPARYASDAFRYLT